MFRWCSYCQKFLGEKEPYDSYEISHGICKKCVENKAMLDQEKLEKSAKIQTLFKLISESILRKDFQFIRTQLPLFRVLKVSNADIFFGLYQPLLCGAGKLWQIRRLTVAEEHELSTTIDELVSLSFSQIPNIEKFRQSKTPAVLLTALSNNQHILGLRLIEHWLCDKGVKNKVIVPGLPANEIISLVKEFHPAVMGLSINAFTPELNSFLSELAREADGSKIIIGGKFTYTITQNDIPAEVSICRNISELSTLLIQKSIITD